ncbi:endo-beta-mannanase [Mycolicibacterium tokaiense]|uniref:Endo-beta-mannanase n=1 Tax=Mycolicibacterium tokaiense TaxID=39695 RepID=A0A378TJ66_9MYCO|nr:endo-beta-mannanase [Mycolicibacterium tokaiense]
MVPVVGRRTALKIPVVASAAAVLTLTQTPRALAAPVRWSPQRAHTWYRAQQWLVGANYIPSNAVNQFEMFQAETFDPSLIQSELRLARLIGINTVRVFLHDQLWTQDRVGFLRRLDQFLGIADRNRIKPLLVLFDSCWDPLPARAGSSPRNAASTTRAGRRAREPSGWVTGATPW